MAEDTKIEWATHTFNCWRGCSKVSEACRHCYAETLSKRNPQVLGVWGPGGTRVVASESQWKEPVKWNRTVSCNVAHGGPRPRVFCASLADVFEDWQGPMLRGDKRLYFYPPNRGWFEQMAYIEKPPANCRPLTMQDVRDRLFALIHRTPNLDWLLLTKRPENVMRFAGCNFCQGPWKPPHDGTERCGCGGTRGFPPNVWVGATVEDQAAADERIPHLLRVPARVRFLSCEPLLSAVDLSEWMYTIRAEHNGDGDTEEVPCKPDIHWVIAGGESGPGARPFELDWARSIQSQCDAAGVPWFMKQAGSNPRDWDRGDAANFEPPELVRLRLKDKKGGDLHELPPTLWVRKFPEVPS